MARSKFSFALGPSTYSFLAAISFLAFSLLALPRLDGRQNKSQPEKQKKTTAQDSRDKSPLSISAQQATAPPTYTYTYEEKEQAPKQSRVLVLVHGELVSAILSAI